MFSQTNNSSGSSTQQSFKVMGHLPSPIFTSAQHRVDDTACLSQLDISSPPRSRGSLCSSLFTMASPGSNPDTPASLNPLASFTTPLDADRSSTGLTPDTTPYQSFGQHLTLGSGSGTGIGNSNLRETLERDILGSHTAQEQRRLADIARFGLDRTPSRPERVGNTAPVTPAREAHFDADQSSTDTRPLPPRQPAIPPAIHYQLPSSVAAQGSLPSSQPGLRRALTGVPEAHLYDTFGSGSIWHQSSTPARDPPAVGRTWLPLTPRSPSPSPKSKYQLIPVRTSEPGISSSEYTSRDTIAMDFATRVRLANRFQIPKFSREATSVRATDNTTTQETEAWTPELEQQQAHNHLQSLPYAQAATSSGARGPVPAVYSFGPTATRSLSTTGHGAHSLYNHQALLRETPAALASQTNLPGLHSTMASPTVSTVSSFATQAPSFSICPSPASPSPFQPATSAENGLRLPLRAPGITTAATFNSFYHPMNCRAAEPNRHRLPENPHEVRAQLLIKGFSPNYRGDPDLVRNQSAAIPADQNCSLFLVGLAPDLTTHELLSGIRGIGRVYATHINPPDPERGHVGSAAKLVFFERAAAGTYQHHQSTTTSSFPPFLDLSRELTSVSIVAERFYEAYAVYGFSTPRNPHLRGRVTWNRIRSAEVDVGGRKSRVLLVGGPPEIVNERFLSAYLDTKMQYQLDQVLHRGASPDGARVLLEFRFGSFRCQAEAAKMALTREFRDLGVVCEYGGFLCMFFSRFEMAMLTARLHCTGWDPCDLAWELSTANVNTQ